MTNRHTRYYGAMLLGLAAFCVLALSLNDAHAAGGMFAGVGGMSPILMAAAGALGGYGHNLRRQLGRKEEGGGGNGNGGDDGDLTAVVKEFRKVSDDLKTFAEDSKKQIRENGALSADTKKSVDELLVRQAELENKFSARFMELEQKSLRRGGGDPGEKSLGQIVADDEGVKKFDAGSKGKVRVEVKQITSLPASGGALVRPDRVQTPIMVPERRMTVRDLLTPGTTGSNLIEYIRETGFTNNADVVSEGKRKPESNIIFDLEDAKVRTIAHWLKATRQIIADSAQLQSYIDGRLRYGLAFKEELQLLKGSGVGENLHGIVPQATAYSPPFAVSGATAIDKLRLALLQAELAEYPATGIVLNPTDWARIELTKTTEGAYIFANPSMMTTPTLWGRPVVPTQAMDVAEFLVGAFKLGAQIFDRMVAAVLISSENEDDFVKNLITILAEERIALAVYRPQAFVTGDLV